MRVTSGVPQGSVLGPVLFLVFINDIDQGITSYIPKFADDTKLMSPCSSTIESETLQSDLRILEIWAELWQMEFNESKCKVLHIGRTNHNFSYEINNTTLSICSSETDLGIITSSDLKSELHCAKVCKIANRIIGLIGRTFEHKSADVILKLYKSLVRPHLEYCVQAWSPHFRKDIDKLERVQQRATRLIANMRHLSYDERLSALNLHSLRRRRTKGDLIEIFKIINGLNNMNFDHYLTFARETTRRNGLKLLRTGPVANTDIRKFSYFNRIVGMWNSLPQEIVNCNQLSDFKSKLDTYMDQNRIVAFYGT
jgi:hypothetical protein